MSDKMREEFERFARNQFGAFRLGAVDGFYSSNKVQDAWFAWRNAWDASRGTLVVVLPDSHNDWFDKQVVQHALNEAGVSYK